jgi:hypothetical protein
MLNPLGTGEPAVFAADLAKTVVAAGAHGCGYEASLEGWYRFLIDPEPPSAVVVPEGTSLAVIQGTSAEVLAQRKAFLRSDSVLGVVMLSDENDCSILDTGYGWLTARAAPMYRSTSACLVNPNDERRWRWRLQLPGGARPGSRPGRGGVARRHRARVGWVLRPRHVVRLALPVRAHSARRRRPDGLPNRGPGARVARFLPPERGSGRGSGWQRRARSRLRGRRRPSHSLHRRCAGREQYRAPLLPGVICATLSVTVARLSVLRALVGAMLVGSVALAQQGLVVEPWRKTPTPAAVAAPAPRAMPGSGLGPVSAAPRKLEAAPQPASSSASESKKWSPPVVELLVDPWAKKLATPVPRSGWGPHQPEIVDPWADEAMSEPPRVASRPIETEHSTIF